MLVILITFLVFGQRLVIPIKDGSIPFLVLFLYLIFLVLLLRRDIYIRRVRLIYYFLAMYGILFSVIVSTFYKLNYSLFSLAYLVVLCFPLVFVFRESKQYEKILATYQFLMAISAILAIFQFASQIMGLPYRDIFNMLPSQFVQKGYATTYLIRQGIPYYKSNGYFFLEPSYLSQFLAIAIIIEFVYFKRILWILLYFIALFTTFSGTGLIALSLGIIFYFFMNYRNKTVLKILLLSTLLGTIVLVFLWHDYGWVFIERVREFGSPRSSSYSRFIAPVLTLKMIFLSQSLHIVWFGFGPGTVEALMDNSLPYKTFGTPVLKLIYEYGIWGFLFFIGYIIKPFIANTRSYVLSLVLVSVYLFLSGSLLEARILYLVYLLGFFVKKHKKVTHKQ